MAWAQVLMILNFKSSPVHYLKNVSKDLGIQVWIKREDLFLKSIGGGSKARKLSKIFPKVLEQDASGIITLGTTGSHHVNATARMGKEFDIKVYSVLFPQPLLTYSRQVYKNTKEILTGYDLSNYRSGFAALLKLYFKLKRQKENLYFIPPGGTNSQGLEAYREAGLELAMDQEKLKTTNVNFIPWDYQICIYGTGGITAGIHLASQIQPTLPPILAIQVYPGFWNGKIYLRYLANKVKRQKIFSRNDFKNIHLSSKYIGRGYGTKDLKNQEAINLFRKDEIFLDPIYMARAGQAIIDLARTDNKVKSLLFWYTPPSTFSGDHKE